MIETESLWIPIVVCAVVAQTVRNAAQRSLVASAGMAAATLARFLYGLPFALLVVLVLHATPQTAAPLPTFTTEYAAWLGLAALAQLAGTACLLGAMRQRNFVVGVAYTKTDVLQVALFSAVFLHEWPEAAAAGALLLAVSGVIVMSLPGIGTEVSSPQRWGGLVALYGLGCGAGFALTAVGMRGAALALPGVSPWVAGAWGVLLTQLLQSLLLGGWLAWRDRRSLVVLATHWRGSLTAGAAGALASMLLFTGLALTSAVNVRTLTMLEVLLGYAVSHRLREQVRPHELAGLALISVGVLALCLVR